MLSTGISALILGLASPLHLLIMAVIGAGAGTYGRTLKNQDFRYLHLEIDERIRRVDRCMRLYGPNHTETLKARLILPDMIRTAYDEQLIDRDDLEMYLELGYIKKDSLHLLTRRF